MSQRLDSRLRGNDETGDSRLPVDSMEPLGLEPRVAQFICCSATIANPGEHVERLTGLPFTVVDNDGSPHGGKEFIFWEPPIIDKMKSTRRSANSEATHLFTELVSQSILSLERMDTVSTGLDGCIRVRISKA